MSLWPSIMTGLTAWAGVANSQPVMWILMASALTFMAMVWALLGLSVYAQRRNPSGKLRILGPAMGIDLVPPVSQKLKSGQQRTVIYMQVGMTLLNEATFPLSIIVENAESKIGEIAPPRTVYPSPAVMAPPGIVMRVMDTRMPMNNTDCKNMDGTFRMKIKYGRSGKEHYELEINNVLELKYNGDGVFEVHSGPAATSTL